MSCGNPTGIYAPNYNKPTELIDFKALVIRSIDRNRTYTNNTETDTSSRFTINVFPVINGNYRVGNITIYNSVYNVTSANNTIYITQSSANYTATLPNGVYTASNLPSAVATALNAITGITGTFSVTYSTTTYLLTITNSTTAFQMNFSSTNVGCADLLGFLRQQSSSALSQVGNFPSNFNTYQSLFINIDQCAARYTNPLKQQAILGCIHVPLVVNSGSLQQIKFSDFPIILTFDQVSQLNIQIRDSAGNIVTLGSEFEMQLIRI